VMSNLSALFRMEPAADPLTFTRDEQTEAGLERYVAQCATDAERLTARIDAIVASGEPFLVWGVGTHTTRLMATSRLAGANIAAFIESNVSYHGKTLGGRPILAPEALRGRSEPVLVSSRVFQREIADQIRVDLGCTNPLILLYDV
jgi:hypothetical protein